MFMSSIKMSVAALALTAAAGAQAAGVNLIANGGFEDPALARVGTWTTLTGTQLTGWLAGPNGVEVRRQAEGSAQEGLQFVELDTSRNSWIQQSVATKVGQEYTLSFWYSPRINRSVAEDNRIDALINDVLVATRQGTTGNIHNWTRTLYTFVANSANTTLRFAAGGPSNSYGGSLDNVSLTATPLPGAALLFATALAGFFGFSNRRKV